jgi:plastocyanin
MGSSKIVVALAACTLVLFSAIACSDSKSGTPTATATTGPSGNGIPRSLTTITISDNKFSPGALQIPVGTTVTWNWTGKNQHSVTGNFDGEDVTSPVQGGAGTFQFTFNHAGVFEYHCGIHGEAMSGTITIQ